MNLVRLNRRDLQAPLERLGWEIRQADLDFSKGSVKLVLQRDTLEVTFFADQIHKPMLERSEISLISDREGRSRVDRLSTRFLGRTRFEDAQEALRGLCQYLVDNGKPKVLTAQDLHNLLEVL